MSMLTRFRKQGGFNQLLTLIEVCDPIKQKNLLHLVGTEDPGWAYLLRSKVLTKNRILGWPQNILMEITPQLSDPVILALHSSLNDNHKLALMNSLPQSILLRVTQNLNADFAIEYSEAEQNAATIKLIQVTRDLENEGKIKFSNFDPSLCLDSTLAA